MRRKQRKEPMLELVKIVGSIAAALMSLITLLSCLIKPIREMFKSWIRRVVESGENRTSPDAITDIKELLAEQKTSTEQMLAEIEHVNKDISLLKSSTKSTIKNMISDIYGRGRKTQTLSANDRESLTHLYDAYHALGGNHYTTIIYEEMMRWDVED